VRVETRSHAVTLYVLYLVLLCLTDTFYPLYSTNTSGWKTSDLNGNAQAYDPQHDSNRIGKMPHAWEKEHGKKLKRSSSGKVKTERAVLTWRD